MFLKVSSNSSFIFSRQGALSIIQNAFGFASARSSSPIFNNGNSFSKYLHTLDQNRAKPAVDVRSFSSGIRMDQMSLIPLMKETEKATVKKPAPDFEGQAVVNGEFKTLKLSDYKGKYLVLFFYPLDFTFVCPTEIIAFSDRFEEFRAINTEVVACSVDSKFSHLAWVNTPRKEGGLGPMKIPLMSDLSHTISKSYGAYVESEGCTLRALYIIDGKGIVRQITMNDMPVGRSVDETLRLVQAFQFTDEKGEVCPIGWRPGDATIKPNPKGAQEYFKSK